MAPGSGFCGDFGGCRHADLDAKRTRLLREAKAIARLSHPNVVVVYDVGTYQDQVFIAMELVDGLTATRWRDVKKPKWKEVLQVFIAAGDLAWWRRPWPGSTHSKRKSSRRSTERT